ncbi:hypothetical protein K443DRAFT_171732 [Laccaria amethystina LaAM-08-1]|uniref:Uncharacterized protein n=1 Tax=Laccaria amethystina LaAM-08-1 TaxID=1095629 RepID=A0A0C9XUA4_9AGAR|nr:hypothetical protein K443DRAFT_171732 [Laccaria amethystina LaAM-08-1]
MNPGAIPESQKWIGVPGLAPNAPPPFPSLALVNLWCNTPRCVNPCHNCGVFVSSALAWCPALSYSVSTYRCLCTRTKDIRKPSTILQTARQICLFLERDKQQMTAT